MGRRVNARGRNPYQRHVRLHHWLLESYAYQAARPLDRALLVELYKLYRGDGRAVFLSVRDAAALLGCGKDQAAASFRRLCDLGFIELERPGGFNVKRNHAAQYRLTEFEDEDGRAGSKAFMRWRPEKNAVPGARTPCPRSEDTKPQ